jgi:hypothetical protein
MGEDKQKDKERNRKKGAEKSTDAPMCSETASSLLN